MALTSVNGFDAGGQRYKGAATPTDPADAVPQGYIAYDLGNIGQAGKPDASALWVDFVAVRKFSFAANFAGSLGIATVAANADATFSVTRNGTQIGTIKFAAGSTNAVFTSTSSTTITIAVSDRLQVTTPSTQDANLSGVTLTLAALRAL